MTISPLAFNDKGHLRAAIYLQDAHPLREGMAFAQYAEAKGFEAVWQAESRLVREATVPMAARTPSSSSVPARSEPIITQDAPTQKALTMCPVEPMPPSAMTGTPNMLASREVW